MADKETEKSNLSCSFCGKKRTEVKKLIAGPTSYICNECISVSHKIINEDDSLEELDFENIPTPAEIKNFLNQYVIGQDYAKEILSVSAYNHYKKIFFDYENEIEKSNVLMIGGTGTGKTLLAQTLAKKLSVPFAIADATTLTEAGYVGEDVESVIERLLNVCDWNIDLAEKGIVFIDEIDKKARSSESNTNTKDISGEGVQQALLRLIEGTTVKVSTGGSKRSDEYIEFDTKNVLFICSGSFVGLDKIVKNRINKKSIGFNSSIDDISDYSWSNSVEPDDLVNFGLIPEFIGRLPNIVGLNNLTEDDMINILNNSKVSVLKQVTKLLEYDDLTLEFADNYIKDVAGIANRSKVGARGLKSIVENSLHSIMFRAPELKKQDIEKIMFKNYPKDVDTYPILVYTNGNNTVDKDYTIKRGKN